MDTNQIEKTLHDAFLNVTRPYEQVIRCERQHAKQPFSIYYFDFSKKLLEPKFSLSEYQQAHLAHDYYRNRGPLQWSFYLVFILDRDDVVAPVPASLRREILEDTSFARKHIVAEGRLSRFVEFSQNPIPPIAAPVDDIVSVWTARLDEADLSDIYTTAPRTQVHSRIDSGKPLADAPASASVGPSGTKLARFDRVVTTSYRKARDDTYDLKKVNLLVGPNGAGKTSFLEAIELALCGQTKRSGAEDGPKVDLVSADGQKITYDGSTNLRESQARAKALYGISAGRGRNPMPEAFSRFNFFSADAAYDLAHKDSAQDIKDAFVKLALGDEADRISRRISKFHEELQSRCRQAENEIEEARETKTTLSDEIVQLASEVESKIPTPSASLQRLDALGLRLQASESTQDQHARIQAILNQVKSITREVTWIDNLTTMAIREEKAALLETKSKVDDLKARQSQLLESVPDTAKRLSELDEALGLLTNATKLQTIQNLKLLDELEPERANLRRQLATFEAVPRLEEKAQDLRTIAEASEMFRKASQSTVAIALEAAQADSKALADREQVVGEARSLLATLRSVGSKYIQVTGDDSSCPLCGKAHESGELELVLQKELDASDTTLEGLRQTADGSRARHDLLHRCLELKTSLEAIESTLQIADAPTSHLNDVSDWLEAVGQRAAQLEQRISALDTLEAALKTQGFSPKQAQAIIASLAAQSQIDLIQTTSEALDSERESKESEKQAIIAAKAEHEAEIERFSSDLRKTLSSALEGLHETEHMLTVLGQRVRAISGAAEAVDALASVVSLEATANIFKLESALERTSEELANPRPRDKAGT